MLQCCCTLVGGFVRAPAACHSPAPPGAERCRWSNPAGGYEDNGRKEEGGKQWKPLRLDQCFLRRSEEDIESRRRYNKHKFETARIWESTSTKQLKHQDEVDLCLCCTFSLCEFSSKTLLQVCWSWLTVTENSVTIIWVSSDLAPWVTTPVMRLTLPRSTCSHSWGLLFWTAEEMLSYHRENYRKERKSNRAFVWAEEQHLTRRRWKWSNGKWELFAYLGFCSPELH